jgi:hypothetical protein
VYTDMRDRGEMLTIAEAPQRTQLFLTGQMIEAASGRIRVAEL